MVHTKKTSKMDPTFVRKFKCQVCGDTTLSPVKLKNRLFQVCHHCGKSAEQTLNFIQGVVFGQVVCMLLGHFPMHRSKKTCIQLEDLPKKVESLDMPESQSDTVMLTVKERSSVDEQSFHGRNKSMKNQNNLSITAATCLMASLANTVSSCSDGEIKIEPAENEDVETKICSDCGKQFSTERNLYLHRAMKHKDKFRERSEDGAGFKMAKGHDRRKRTKRASDQETEQLGPKQTKELPCRACWKMFNKKSTLKAHQRVCHKDKLKLHCKLCSKIFYTKKGLAIHMTQTHKATRDCDVCGESYPNYRELYNHKSSKHGLQHSVCHICGKHFKFQGALKGHLDAHAGVKRHFCDVCGKGFVRATSLYGHKANSHSDKPRLPNKRPRRTNAGDALQCQLCSETFVTKALINKHLLNEHSCGPYLETRKTLLPGFDSGGSGPEQPGTSFRCDLCGLHCMTAQGLEMHRLQRGECVRTHICPDCGKGFTTAGYLQVHMRQHKEARFQCDECGKKFTYKCNLQSHLSVHKPKDTDKPFQCEVCKKRFRLQSYLDMHIRKHKQELALKCYICGKGLTRPQNLRNHILKMHPEAQHL